MRLAAPQVPASEGGAAARAVLVALLAAGGLVAFTGFRPSQPWLLYFTAGVVALSSGGTVRGHPRWVTHMELATLGSTFLPALTVLAIGAFADRVLEGYTRPLVACGGAILAGLTVLAEYHAVDQESRVYGAVRIVLAVAIYATAFGVFGVMFQGDIDLVISVLAIGFASWLLATSLLREGGSVGEEAFLAGLAVGISVAELRAILYFLPIEGVLGGAILLVGFHVAAGIVHHLLDRDLSVGTVAEYATVMVAAVAAVVTAGVVD